MENKKEGLTEAALRGSFWEFTASMIQRAGSFIFIIIVARLLLPEKFGLYSLVLSISLIFMLFSYSGANETFVRYMAEGVAKSKNRARAYFGYILKLKITSVILVSGALAILAYPLSFFIFKKPAMFVPLLFSVVYISLLSLEGLFSSFFFVVKKVQYSTVKNIIYQFLRVSVVSLLLLVFFPEPKAIHVIMALIAGALGAFVYSVYKTYRIAPYLFREKIPLPKKDKNRIFNFFFYAALGSMSFIFLGRIDTVMLGFFLNETSSIGLYRAAFALVASITGLLGFGPVLVPIFVQTKKKNLERAFNEVYRYLMSVAIPAAFGLAVLGNYFLALIYGKAYLAAALPMIFLPFLMVFGPQVGLFINLFATKERPKDYLPLFVGIIIINIILNYILIKFFLQYSEILAITGVAIATITSWIIYSIGLSILVKRKLDIKTNIGVMVKPLIASLIMVGVVYLLKILIGDISVISGVLLVSSGVMVYSVFMLLIGGINKEDFTLAREVLSRLK